MSNRQPIFERLVSLHGKTALITGAGSGIGGVLAAALAEAGTVVGIHDIAAERLTETARAIAAVGSQAIPLTADLHDVEACRGLIADAHNTLDRLDILVNCAAMNRRKPIAAVTQDDFDTIVAVNLRSIYSLCQAAHPIMRARGGGKIIQIGSINIFYGLDTVSVYGLTKAALAR